MSDEIIDSGPGTEAPPAQSTDVSTVATPPEAGSVATPSETDTGDVTQKRIEDLTRQLNEERSRADKRINEETQKLNERMAQTIERMSTQQVDPQQAEREAEATLKALSEQIDQAIADGTPGSLLAELQMQQATALRQQTEARMKEMEDQFTAKLEDLDPDVVSADKQKVAELQEKYGVTRKVAAQMYKDFQAQVQAAKGPDQPPAQQHAGNGATQHVIPATEVTAVSDQTLAAIGNVMGKVTPAEATKLAEIRAARKKGNR